MPQNISSKNKMASILAADMEERYFPELFRLGFERHPNPHCWFGWDPKDRRYRYDFIMKAGVDKIILLSIWIWTRDLDVLPDVNFIHVPEKVYDLKGIVDKYHILSANFVKYGISKRFSAIRNWEIWKTGSGYRLGAKERNEEDVKADVERIVNRMIGDLGKFMRFIEWPDTGYVELSMAGGVVKVDKR